MLRKQCPPFAGIVARTPFAAPSGVPEREKVVAFSTHPGRHGETHSRHARLRYSVIAPTPSELCLADGATGRSDARAVELPISVWAYFRPGIGVKFGIRAETILA